MGNRFEIAIAARDQFTAMFRKLNGTAANSTRALASAQRASENIFSGLQPANISRITSSVERLAGSLSALPGPFAALGGAGLVAGLAAFTSRFAEMGSQVIRNSRRLDIDQTALQEWTAAAKTAGVEAQDFAGSLASLGKALHDGQFGRAPDVVQLLSKFGTGLRVKGSGVVDVVETLVDLSRVLSRTNDPYTRSKISEVFGIDDRTLDFLAMGPDEVLRRLNAQRARGVALTKEETAALDGLTQSANNAYLAVETLGKRMAAKLAPAFSLGLDTFSKAADASAPGKGGFTLDPAKADAFKFLFGGDMLRALMGGAGLYPASKDPRPGMAGRLSEDAGPLRLNTKAGADQFEEDLRNGAQFNDGARRRLLGDGGAQVIHLNVKVEGAQSATVRATSADVPVRIGATGHW